MSSYTKHQDDKTLQYHRTASIVRRVRYTEDAYAVLQAYKANVERVTGRKLSDAYALETILLGMAKEVYDGKV